MINPFFENKGPKKIEEILTQIKFQNKSEYSGINIFDIKESQIKFSTISENEYLKHGQKINMIDILFKKIEKNHDLIDKYL